MRKYILFSIVLSMIVLFVGCSKNSGSKVIKSAEINDSLSEIKIILEQKPSVIVKLEKENTLKCDIDHDGIKEIVTLVEVSDSKIYDGAAKVLLCVFKDNNGKYMNLFNKIFWDDLDSSTIGKFWSNKTRLSITGGNNSDVLLSIMERRSNQLLSLVYDGGKFQIKQLAIAYTPYYIFYNKDDKDIVCSDYIYDKEGSYTFTIGLVRFKLRNNEYVKMNPYIDTGVWTENTVAPDKMIKWEKRYEPTLVEDKKCETDKGVKFDWRKDDYTLWIMKYINGQIQK